MPRRTNLDLDLVRAFLVVCEQRSFTRAGERLGRSQSAVSLQVRRLEEQLGQPLLSRDPRHVAPTEQGAAFLPQARRLLRLNDEILASLGARWTTRIIVVPGETLLRRGPYRFVRHPNYLLVAAEIAVLPMVFGLPGYALVFSILNATVLFVRIRAEERALHFPGPPA